MQEKEPIEECPACQKNGKQTHTTLGYSEELNTLIYVCSDKNCVWNEFSEETPELALAHVG